MNPSSTDALLQSGTFEDVYRSLRRVVSDDDPKNRKFAYIKGVNIYSVLNMSSTIFNGINAYLEQLGITSMQFENCGDNTLVFGAPDNLMLKINTNESAPDDAIKDFVLQPLVHHRFEHKMHSAKLRIVPRVNTKDVTKEHVNALGIALAKRGYVFWDNKLENNLENVGLLPDGTPVLIDPGAVIPISLLSSIEDKQLRE